MEVRRLTEADVEAYRELRLEALKRHPEAFQATYETSAELTLDAFARRLKQYALFGGFIDGRLCGFVGFYPLKHPRTSHKGILWGMYVREDARGGGLAQALVDAVVEHAKGRVEQILLSVITANERACRFYEKAGFEAYGRERRALKLDGRYYDEEFRVKFL